MLCSQSFAEYQRPIDWDGNIYKIINQYEKLHKEFFKEVCHPKDPRRYSKLLRLYRGQGYYLPKLGEDIDRQAIIKNLHHFKKKLDFIDKQVNRLKKLKTFPNYNLVSAPLDTKITSLLNLKKKYHQALTVAERSKVIAESRVELAQLKKLYDHFTDQLFFLRTYNYPNNFLENRRKYEDLKGKDGIKDKKKSNEMYFYRRLTEDGAYAPDRSKPDKYIRTVLDTLHLEINKSEDFLSENVRYDIKWIERHLDKILTKGKESHLARLKEWRDRTKDNFDFYVEIIATKNKNKAKFLIKKENEAAYNLKNFVYRKEAQTYAWWAKKPKLMKALFSMETILVHEVGVLDGEHGLERMSVAGVVLNRVNDSFYNQLAQKQLILKFIPDDIDVEDEHWLNVLFRVGEFSFTYHYIPAVSGIFCPDMSRRGRSIRKDNLKFALRAMKFHDGKFNAFRYFSRISMLGKIDMSTVWTNYVRMPEIPGLESTHQRQLVSYYYADRYQYLYSFRDARGVQFAVVQIKDKSYAMRWSKGIPVFHDYRDPHLFAYFSKKN